MASRKRCYRILHPGLLLTNLTTKRPDLDHGIIFMYIFLTFRRYLALIEIRSPPYNNPNISPPFHRVPSSFTRTFRSSETINDRLIIQRIAHKSKTKFCLNPVSHDNSREKNDYKNHNERMTMPKNPTYDPIQNRIHHGTPRPQHPHPLPHPIPEPVSLNHLSTNVHNCLRHEI